MRFAAVATLVTAMAAAPFVAQAAGSKMSEDEFVQAAQCLAYDAALPHRAGEAHVAAVKAGVAFGQLSQPQDAVARARTEIREIKALAATGDVQAIETGLNTACGGPAMTAHVNESGAPA